MAPPGSSATAVEVIRVLAPIGTHLSALALSLIFGGMGGRVRLQTGLLPRTQEPAPPGPSIDLAGHGSSVPPMRMRSRPCHSLVKSPVAHPGAAGHEGVTGNPGIRSPQA